MLDQIIIFFKKLRMIPLHKLGERVLLGIRKRLIDQPYSITIQTVSACNLKCKHCFINDYHTHIHDGVVKIMRFDEFVLMAERLRPMLRKASYVAFSTFEAIMNKHLFSMMDVVLEINPKIQFPFLSNTMLIDQEKIDRLSKYPISEINVSLDGYTAETVETFKTEVVFDKIIDTIRLLKASPLSEKVAVTFVAHSGNVHELADYVDFVHALGVKQIYVSNLLTFTAELVGKELYSKTGNPDVQSIFDEAVRRAKRNRQLISMPRLAPKTLGCQATETFYIDIKGNVAPCDFLGVSTPFTLWGDTIQNPPLLFGNVFEEEPVSIYRKPTFRSFRKAHQMGKNIPKVCQNCIDAYGLMCSNRIAYE
jgi:MoaA/NifB/PqqE/SkfB family radical SAM enzyme